MKLSKWRRILKMLREARWIRRAWIDLSTRYNLWMCGPKLKQDLEQAAKKHKEVED